MTTLACVCGGVLEALVFLSCAGFAWLANLLRLRWRHFKKPCEGQCCVTENDNSRRTV
jgi:hypothetical protein